MPVIFEPKYPASNIFLRNSFIQLLLAKFLRPVKELDYERERLDLPDGDFLDLDWSKAGSKTLAIVCHGLDGNSTRRYMKSVVAALNENSIDALAINFRGCSGEKNKKYFLQYGEIEDYALIVDHVLETRDYESIVLVGCSVGGNLILRYLSNKADSLDKRIKSAFTVSPTVDLKSSCEELHTLKAWVVLKAFLISLFWRVWRMRDSFEEKVYPWDFFKIKTFYDFYKRYVFQQSKLPVDEYFEKNSSFNSLDKITIPSYILLSSDDPMVDHRYYPYEQAYKNPNIILHVTAYGGHVGFTDFTKKYFWSETLMLDFFS